MNKPLSVANLSGWRLYLSLALLLMVVLVTVALGRWQLSRAEEKQALLQAMQAASRQPALVLEPEVERGDLLPWRPALAYGAWQPGFTVLLENRNHEGRPGYWVVTPFCLRSPDAQPGAAGVRDENLAMDCDQAIAVLRGWLARPAPGDALPEIDSPPGVQMLQGVLLGHVPRLFDLSAVTPGAAAPQSVPHWDAGMPVQQNLALDDLASATGLPLLPVVLEQHGDTADGLVRDWAGPSVDVDTHRGYALQWFSFAAIAFIALGVILVKTARRIRR